MDARQIIDYAAEDNAKDFREALYASIYDKINSHIETMKQGIAHNLVAQEETVSEAKDCECEDEKEKEGHEDEKEDKAMIKKMVKKDALKTEEVEQIDEISKDTLKSYVKKASTDAGTDQLKMVRKDKDDKVKTGAPKEGPDYRNIGKQREKGISKALDKLTKEEMESIEESVSRKHFQMVADVIKSHDNHDKRKELAQHHATIFAAQNPRFDRAKFMKAANVQE